MRWQRDLLVLAGAAAGGLLGHFAFLWLVGQGFYAMILPGGLLGLGAGLARHGTLYLAVICGIMALLLGLVTEWRAFPFNADESLPYFLTHIHQLKPLTLIMIGVGAAIGFWIPFRSSSSGNEAGRPG